jgi:arabinan endo-1,5-alpha-L-arabinosidase
MNCTNIQLFSLLCLGLLGSGLAGCGGSTPSSSTTTLAPVTTSSAPGSPFDQYELTGDVSFVHDPSIIRQGATYYAFTTDPGPAIVAANPALADGLQIRCSTDKIAWKICGTIFSSPPAEITAVFPGFTTFWAPDVSFFNGLYHVYYAASGFGANHSLIGLVTNTTLDSTDPNYKWVDQGIVLSSQTTDNFNAIDPNILVDTDANGNLTHVWIQYGSFWNGIFQREIDPATGLLSTSNTSVVNLATRPGVLNDPIEGASMVAKDGYYYLFVSFDYCCQTPASESNYKIAVGRSTSPNGPFVDESGTAMMAGGGTILLAGNGSTWSAPGGQTIYIDPVDGDLITFHALNVAQNYLDYLFVNSIIWTNGWPVIQP